MIEFVASYGHYFDHLALIWNEIPESKRGSFIAYDAGLERAEEVGVTTRRYPKWSTADVLVAAGWRDLIRYMGAPTKPKLVLVEHGTGQSYGTGHSHYAGGYMREELTMLVAPSKWIADQAPDNVAKAVVGSPKLDPWWNYQVDFKTKPTVCVSFHWPASTGVPESGTAWPDFKDALPQMNNDDRYKLVLHAHPRFADVVRVFADKHGIQFLPNFEDVLLEASLYVCDNSSTIYEFAALDRPVVLMNAKGWRRDVSHGLRFWDYLPGPQVDDARDLSDVVDEALVTPGDWHNERMSVLSDLYGGFTDGKASERAAKAIMSL